MSNHSNPTPPPAGRVPFLLACGDADSLRNLRAINRNHRPAIYLPSRHVPSGMQASILGFGVIPESTGIPIITRLYAARLPSPDSPPTMLRRNPDGRWITATTKNAQVLYAGKFPAHYCKPGESFFRVVSTLLPGKTIPIHTFDRWIPAEMRWTNSRPPVDGLVGILPVNQGMTSATQDHNALTIHAALYTAGFVVSANYPEKFLAELPAGFPEATAKDILEAGPDAYIAALETWSQHIKESIPTRNPGEMKQLVEAYTTKAKAEIEEIIAANLARKSRMQDYAATNPPAPAPAEPKPDSTDEEEEPSPSMSDQLEEFEPAGKVLA